MCRAYTRSDEPDSPRVFFLSERLWITVVGNDHVSTVGNSLEKPRFVEHSFLRQIFCDMVFCVGKTRNASGLAICRKTQKRNLDP